MRRLVYVLIVCVLVGLSFWGEAREVTTRTDPAFVGPRIPDPLPVLKDLVCLPPIATITSLPFSHSGNTCGSVNSVDFYTNCGLLTPYPGEEVIYEITLGEMNMVEFTLDLTGSTGDLMLALIGICGDGTSCVGNSQDAIGVGVGPEVLPENNYPAGTYYLYVDSFYNAGTAGSCGTYTLTIDGTLPVDLFSFTVD